MSHPLTVRLPDDDIEKLDAIARATDRKRSWHMSRAISLYIKDEHAFLEGVKAGIEAADRGDVVSHDTVDVELDALFQKKVR
tara:strand:- start:33 stop:278 length:246 start_codon:yes stop_codon:yes gene_type:complete